MMVLQVYPQTFRPGGVHVHLPAEVRQQRQIEDVFFVKFKDIYANTNTYICWFTSRGFFQGLLQQYAEVHYRGNLLLKFFTTKVYGISSTRGWG